MLKHVVNYKDPLTGDDVTETLHFNLSKAELAEIVLVDDEYGNKLEAVAKREDPKELLETVKDIVRRSYGEVVETGGRRRFVKSDEASLAFMGSEAFSTFFFELFTDPQKTYDFINGVMPQDLLNGSAEELVAQARANRPVPQDRLPKKIKNVELPAEDPIEIDGIQEENALRARRAELEQRPANELSIDELIELKTLQED